MIRLVHHKGFTLIELLLVIAIISALAGIVLIALNPAQRLNDANEVKDVSHANDLEKALNAYVLANNGQYPSELQTYFSQGAKTVSICKSGQTCVGVDLTSSLVTGGYIQSIPANTGYDTTTKSGYDVNLVNTVSGAKILGVVGTPTFLLRDEFTTAASAPLTSPRTAEPGPGTLTKIDTNNALSVSSDKLQIGTGLDHGDPALYGAGLSVVTGRAVLSKYTIVTDNTNQSRMVGFSIANPEMSTTNGYGFALANGAVLAGSSATRAQTSTYSIGTPLETAVVMRTNGLFAFQRQGNNWSLEMVSQFVPVTTIYPYIRGRTTHWNVDYIRVLDLPAPFNDDYGIATQRLSGNVIADQAFTHEGNGVIEFVVTTMPSSGVIQVAFRQQDVQNLWFVEIYPNGDFLLRERIANVPTTRATASAVMANGHRVIIVFDGTTIKAYSNNTLRWTYSSANNYINETDGVMRTLQGGSAVSDIVAWPRTLTGSAAAALDKGIE